MLNLIHKEPKVKLKPKTFFSEQLHLFENERNQLRQNGRRELQGRVARKIFRGQRLDRKFCCLLSQFFSLRHEFTTFQSVFLSLC